MMMKLSIMRDFLQSPLCKEQVKGVLSLWDYEKDSERFIRVSSNFVFSFKSGDDSFILRLTPGEDQHKLKREMDFLTILSKQGLIVNTPVPSMNGKLIEPLVTEAGNFQAVVFQFFCGEHLEIDGVSNDRMIAWGRALGSLHAASNGAASLREHSRLERLFEGKVAGMPAAVQQEEAYLREWLNGLEQSSEVYGPLHFDLELDNILWRGSVPQIIDFESSLTGWYAADIAFALRDLVENAVDLQDGKFNLFLEGYRQAWPIGDKEVENIPMFLRFRRLITYKQLLLSLDLRVEHDQPDWVQELMMKLGTKITQYVAGLELED
jgi:Ser/Thr protein kinase RdoA (MazF antagonist)